MLLSCGVDACVCVCVLCVQTYYLQRYTDTFPNMFTLVEHVRVMGVMHTTGVQTLQLERPMHVNGEEFVVT